VPRDSVAISTEEDTDENEDEDEGEASQLQAGDGLAPAAEGGSSGLWRSRLVRVVVVVRHAILNS